ncbi:UNVERIFIED_CONTAM: hypothetical protein HDU68_010448, partial [Siphonaria sp. JEL0065]
MQGTDANDFFQSDRDLEIQRKRELKKAQLLSDASKTKHDALIRSTSKVLAFVISTNKLTKAYIGESGHVARRIDLETGSSEIIYRGHKGPVTCVAVESDPSTGSDRFVYTGSWDKTIKKFDAE